MKGPITWPNLRCEILVITWLMLAATGCQALERRFVYNAVKYSRDLAPPSQNELNGLSLEQVWFDCSDGTRLNGWFVQPAATVPANAILYSHGRVGSP